MYFPYLKLRQQEAIALKDTVCNYKDTKVIPVIEPYCKRETDTYSYKSLINVVKYLAAANKKFILIIDNENDLITLKRDCADFDKYCIRGYYSDNPALVNYGLGYEIAVIHKNSDVIVTDASYIRYHIMMPSVLRFTTYLKNYPLNKTVKIEDGFVKHSPNSTYPPSETFNSESVFTFKGEGYAGFGDFTIMEEDYEVAEGAQANTFTHVIHLTRKQDNAQKLEVCHFLTTPSIEPDSRRRSIMTIEQAYNARNRFIKSAGIALIVAKRGQSTNAAYYKRIGIVHHIELMRSLF